MSAESVQRIFALIFVIGLSQAGLVHQRNAKENAPATSLVAELRKDRIPVAILLESDAVKPVQALNLQTEAPPAAAAVQLPVSAPKSELPIVAPAAVKAQTQQLLEKLPEKSDLIESSTQNADPELQLLTTEALTAAAIDEIQTQKNDAIINEAAIAPAAGIAESSTILAAIVDGATTIQQALDLQQQPVEILEPETGETNLVTAVSAPLPDNNDLKALPQVVATGIAAQDVVAQADSAADDLERQATQATPTDTSTPQNFVQQLIQNSPIGQFLSQFTGGQQQQQQPQQQLQADQPATPQPTLPGFLNPANAITSAQQAVQNVVNTTTQAFQGLQQFATNLGTQFQNTFSNLAGQQNQLSTADSTTPRPLGPIQQIVSNFIGGNNATAATGQQPGPLQGILGFFQAGNRPQGAAVVATTAPPKEAVASNPGVDDKIETQSLNDVAVELPAEEPQSANEVRSSAEVNSEDTSFEVGPSEDLIIVQDDATQQDVSA